MGKDSALYQLMDTRMNGVMNGIVSVDGNTSRSAITLAACHPLFLDDDEFEEGFYIF